MPVCHESPALLVLVVSYFIGFAQTDSIDDITTCSGFVRSAVPLAFEMIKLKLVTRAGNLKAETEAAPNNGYFLLPAYDRGQYILRIEGPSGWTFDPPIVELNLDGSGDDQCSRGRDINFTFKGFSIIGKVVSAGSADGPAGATISLVSKGDAAAEKRFVATQAGGNFVFPAAMPGLHTVTFRGKQLDVRVDNENVRIDESTFVIEGYSLEGRVEWRSGLRPASAWAVLAVSASTGGTRTGSTAAPVLPSLEGVNSEICCSSNDNEAEIKLGDQSLLYSLPPGLRPACATFANLSDANIDSSKNSPNAAPAGTAAATFVFGCVRSAAIQARGGAAAVAVGAFTAGRHRMVVEPSFVDVHVAHADIQLERVFRVVGFEVTGMVESVPLANGGADSPGVEVRVTALPNRDGASEEASSAATIVTVTDTAGLFRVQLERSGRYKFEMKARGVEFDPVEIDVNADHSGMIGPLKADRFEVCGRIDGIAVPVEMQFVAVSVTSSDGGDNVKKSRSSPVDNGAFCAMLSRGDYLLRPTPIEVPADAHSDVGALVGRALPTRFSPSKYQFTVPLSPSATRDDLVFSPFEVSVRGRVICRSASLGACNGIRVELRGAMKSQTDFTIGANQLHVVTDANGAFSFSGLGAGAYELCVTPHVMLCFDKECQAVTVVDGDVEGVTFNQKGFFVRLQSTHATDVAVDGRQFRVAAGGVMTTQCITGEPRATAVVPIGCHHFAAPSNGLIYRPTGPDSVLRLIADAHLLEVVVLAKVAGLDDLLVTVEDADSGDLLHTAAGSDAFEVRGAQEDILSNVDTDVNCTEALEAVNIQSKDLKERKKGKKKGLPHKSLEEHSENKVTKKPINDRCNHHRMRHLDVPITYKTQTHVAARRRLKIKAHSAHVLFSAAEHPVILQMPDDCHEVTLVAETAVYVEGRIQPAISGVKVTVTGLLGADSGTQESVHVITDDSGKYRAGPLRLPFHSSIVDRKHHGSSEEGNQNSFIIEAYKEGYTFERVANSNDLIGVKYSRLDIFVGAADVDAKFSADDSLESETALSGSYAKSANHSDDAKSLSEPSLHTTIVKLVEPLAGALVSVTGGPTGEFRNKSRTENDGRVSLVRLAPGSYYVRVLMKEYRFEPVSAMVVVSAMSDAQVRIVGRKIAYSVTGRVISLTGEGEPEVPLEAVSDEACDRHEENAVSNGDNGAFRIRGLRPQCTYRLRLKHDHHASSLDQNVSGQVSLGVASSSFTSPEVAGLESSVGRPHASITYGLPNSESNGQRQQQQQQQQQDRGPGRNSNGELSSVRFERTVPVEREVRVTHEDLHDVDVIVVRPQRTMHVSVAVIVPSTVASFAPLSLGDSQSAAAVLKSLSVVVSTSSGQQLFRLPATRFAIVPGELPIDGREYVVELQGAPVVAGTSAPTMQPRTENSSSRGSASSSSGNAEGVVAGSSLATGYVDETVSAPAVVFRADSAYRHVRLEAFVYRPRPVYEDSVGSAVPSVARHVGGSNYRRQQASTDGQAALAGPVMAVVVLVAAFGVLFRNDILEMLQRRREAQTRDSVSGSGASTTTVGLTASDRRGGVIARNRAR